MRPRSKKQKAETNERAVHLPMNRNKIEAVDSGKEICWAIDVKSVTFVTQVLPHSNGTASLLKT